MKKLKLDAESIKVESFTTRPEPPRRGTVRGNESDSDECTGSCHAGATCYVTDCGTYIATNCWPYCDSADTCQTCGCQSKPSACHDCEI